MHIKDCFFFSAIWEQGNLMVSRCESSVCVCVCVCARACVYGLGVIEAERGYLSAVEQARLCTNRKPGSSGNLCAPCHQPFP